MVLRLISVDEKRATLLEDSSHHYICETSNVSEVEYTLRSILEQLKVKTEMLLIEPQVLFAIKIDGFYYQLLGNRLDLYPPKLSLSPREQEIVRLVAKGLPNKSIALVLEISPCTVATYMRRIFSKLGVSCRAEMIARISSGGVLVSF